MLAEYDENGTLTTNYTRADELISQERSGAKSYYLYDGSDSVRMLANEDGEITDTYTFDAFGNLTASTGSTKNDFLYRGEQYDSFTGLYYLRARYMNPATGTFITMDEYAGSMFEPVSLHKYLYANANPVMYSDPSGYSAEYSLNGLMQACYGMGELAKTAVANSVATLHNILISLSSSMIIALTPFAAFIANNPAFLEMCSRIASGDISSVDIINDVIHLISEIDRKIQDWIQNASNGSSSNPNSAPNSSGNINNSGGFNSNDPNLLQKIKEALSHVSNKFKGYGQCDKFMNSFTKQLDKMGIKYEKIFVESNYPNSNIVSDHYGGAISENGFHWAVKIGDMVYDNINSNGIIYDNWLADLGGLEFVTPTIIQR